MFRYFLFFFIIFLSSNLFSNESSLTIQQQIERLQREVSDLSKSIFSNQSVSNSSNDNNLVSNLSAIDMRIYDLEKDVKNLNAQLEEILFQIEDITKIINNFESTFSDINNNLISLKDKNKISDQKESDNIAIDKVSKDENTLGSLKIESENNTLESQSYVETPDDTNDVIEDNKNISPEDQFQIAFDYIRDRKYDDAKNLLELFIKNNPENQLSGSAHYWLGELNILDKQYRDAALIFAEGYQKFPKSIKAPDMLYKLSQSLFEVNKNVEACKTMEKFLNDYPKHKLVKKININLLDKGCLELQE